MGRGEREGGGEEGRGQGRREKRRRERRRYKQGSTWNADLQSFLRPKY